MKIDYEICKQDYIDIYIYLSYPNKTALFVQRYIFPIVLLIIPPFLIGFTNTSDFWGFEFICALMFLLWIIFYPKFLKYNFEKANKNYENMVNSDKNEELYGIGEYSVLIDEDGILEKSEKGEKRIMCNKLRKIISTDSHFFIKINLLEGILIPKRAFKNESSMNDFFQFVNKMIDKNR